MNVKVCSFPEGEDPDSFAKKHTLDDLKVYLDSNSKDFIQYKASMLVEESKNDPVKKAETIRDIIGSISKIPDHIKREVYIQECSKIMEISEEVLFSTLAQLSKKENNSSQKRAPASLQVVTQKTKAPKVDIQYHLERKIIEILLLYGKKAEDFEDLVLKEDEVSGELKLEPEVVNLKVFDKIYMDLQEDEMLFSNQIFQDLYHSIITAYGQTENFSTTNFINGLNQDLAIEVTSILMDDEKYNLHDWERNNIITKGKEDSIAQLVTQTILNLRCFLIDKKVIEFKQKTLEPESDSRIIMEDVKDYLSLKMLLSRKLGRVVGNNLS